MPTRKHPLTRIGLLLEEAQLHHMQTVEEQAAAIGISYNTLKTVKYGYRKRINRVTFTKIASYLGYEALRLNEHMLTGAALS